MDQGSAGCATAKADADLIWVMVDGLGCVDHCSNGLTTTAKESLKNEPALRCSLGRPPVGRSALVTGSRTAIAPMVQTQNQVTSP